MNNICKTLNGNNCNFKGTIRTINGKQYKICSMHYNQMKRNVNIYKCDTCDKDAEFEYSYWDINDYMETEKFCKECFLELHECKNNFTQAEAWNIELKELGITNE